MTTPSDSTGRLRRAATAVELRIRVQRVLDVAPPVLALGLVSAAALLATHKLAPHALGEESVRRAFFWLGGITGVVFAAVGLYRLAPGTGALRLDKHHGLAGRVANALSFQALPAKERTPFMDAAIEDAAARAASLAPAQAAPLRLGGEWFAPAALGLLVFGLAQLEIRTLRPEPPPPPPLAPLLVTQDDLDLFRDASKDLADKTKSPEVKEAIERFNKVVEGLAERKLDRTEAFRQMEAIERDVLQGAEVDKAALEEELRKTAKDLAGSELAKDLTRALEKNDLDKAKDAMKELAERLRDKKTKLDPAALERLRQALQKAAERRKEALAALEQRRSELQEQLLKKKKDLEAQQDPNKKREEERLLRKKERELERLDRQREQQQRANRELERLDRELAEAAADLMKELGLTPEELAKAAQDLEQAAEDMNRMQQEQMSQKDKEELKQRLDELREMLRQQGQGGKKRMSRMIKFSKRARGGSGSPGGSGQEPGEGEEGDEGEEGEDGRNGKKGRGQGEGQEGEDGQGGPGQRGKKGRGQGQGDGPIELTLGPGGAPIPMPGAGSGSGSGDQPGDGSGQGGKEAGRGSGGPVAGDRTDPNMGTVDVEAAGAEAGQGPTNSEVILSAAEKGFRGAPYKKVFTDYKTVAEEHMAQEQIPDGYRFYVQRYFQLIRPRD